VWKLNWIQYPVPTMNHLLFAFFWVIPRHLNFICRRFGTLCLFHLHRQVGVKNELGLRMLGYLYRKGFGSKIAWANKLVHSSHLPPMKMEQNVPKRRHINFRRRGITQKKGYNIQNTAKVWDQEWTTYWLNCYITEVWSVSLNNAVSC